MTERAFSFNSAQQETSTPLGRSLDRMVKRKRCASANPAVADKAELFTAKLAEALHDQALAPAQVRLLASCSS